MHPDVAAYNERQDPEARAVCDILASAIDAGLPDAESRIWHAHPVWFLEGNPIVGYSRLKDGVRLLFWSGQSFDVPGLVAQGKFKAAEARYANAADVDTNVLAGWLKDAEAIQWDYKNIVKRRGRLERLR